MVDVRIEKLAEVLVKYSIKAKKGQEIIISSPPGGTQLALEVYREVLDAGAHPLMMPVLDGAQDVFFEHASDGQLGYASPIRKFLYEKADGLIGIRAAVNTRSMSNVPPGKMALNTVANTEIREILSRRTAKKEFSWVGLIYPTNAQAQEASMSLGEYEDFVFSACLVDKKAPIAEWKKVARKQNEMIKRFKNVNRLHFLGEDTDLKMSIKGRGWNNCCGLRNMPDGEIFTSPMENSVNGRIRFTFPGIYMGKEVEDISLEFKKGKVVKVRAEKGEELLKSLIRVDEGAQRLGEVAIGTNKGIKKFTHSILFDEKISGTIHMALGRGDPAIGSKNMSALHWDMIKDMKKGGEIIADGETVYKNGNWLG